MASRETDKRRGFGQEHEETQIDVESRSDGDKETKRKRNTSGNNEIDVTNTCASALEGSSSVWRNMAQDDK
jgi:hypothetical protein